MRHVLVFGSLLALFLLLITRNVSPEPYGYDEADYMYAASLGFAANWTDTPSISIADFLASRSQPPQSEGPLRTHSRQPRRSVLPALPRSALSLLLDSRVAARPERARCAHADARDSRRQPGRHLFRMPLAGCPANSASLKPRIARRHALPDQPLRGLVHRTRASSALRSLHARVSHSSGESHRYRTPPIGTPASSCRHSRFARSKSLSF
jgi:hypothetical protein